MLTLNIIQIKDKVDQKKITNFVVAKQKLSVLVSSFVAEDGFSFNQVATSKGLRKLMLKAQYSNLPRTHNGVRNLTFQFAREIRSKMILELAEQKKTSLFTVIIDEWTSISSIRYLNVILHCAGKRFWNLGLAEIHDSATSENCRDCLIKKLSTFSINFDSDMVAVVSDGCSVMTKLGQLILPVQQQLCIVHGIQLAIVHTLYKKSDEMDDASANMNIQDFDESDTDIECTDDEELTEEDKLDENATDEDVLNDCDRDDLMDFLSLEDLEMESDLCLQIDYNSIITKVRKIVKTFRNKPKRIEKLRFYIKEDKKSFSNLILDCPTRWSSMANMIQRFLDLRTSIAKASISLGISFDISKNEILKLKDLCTALMPIKATVDALCRSDINLISADGLILNLLTNLQLMNTSISLYLFHNLVVEIGKRRTIVSDALKFLHTGEIDSKIHGILNTPIPNEADFYLLFDFVCKNLPANDSNNLINYDINNNDGVDIQDTPTNFADSIDYVINATMSVKPKTVQNNFINDLELELCVFKKTGSKSPNLSFIYNSLLSIKPSSVECERTFSSSGYLNNALRNKMLPKTLDTLVFLRYHFQNNGDKYF